MYMWEVRLSLTIMSVGGWGQQSGTRIHSCLLVHEHVNTWPLQGTKPADHHQTQTASLLCGLHSCCLRLWAGWRTRRRLYPRIRPWTAACWCCRTTGGWLGCTAWTADTTSRSCPMAPCMARGMTGTITVRLLQRTAHFLHPGQAYNMDAFTSFTTGV